MLHFRFHTPAATASWEEEIGTFWRGGGRWPLAAAARWADGEVEVVAMQCRLVPVVAVTLLLAATEPGAHDAPPAVVLRSDGVDGVFRLRGWELDGLRGLNGLSVATSDGIGLGTTVEELLSAIPDTVFGASPEPGCGDVWWSPGVFSAGDGLRGEVGSPPADPGSRMLLDQTLVRNGFPDGLECDDDVMCCGLSEEVRMALGLQPAFGLDRELWFALGLPLPFDQTAPVVMLRAGTLATTC